MDKIIEKWANCVPDKIEDSILATLEELSKKYEMVCLTDWYKEQQIEKNKYFKIFSRCICCRKYKKKTI